MQDKVEATRFLEKLDSGNGFSFQTFGDGDEEKRENHRGPLGMGIEGGRRHGLGAAGAGNRAGDAAAAARRSARSTGVDL